MNPLKEALAHMHAQSELVRSLRRGSDLNTSYAYKVFPGNSRIPVMCEVLNRYVWPWEHLRHLARDHVLMRGVRLAHEDLLRALGSDIQLTVYADVRCTESDQYVAVRVQSPKGSISLFTGDVLSAFHYPGTGKRFIDTDGSCQYLRTTETQRYIETAEDIQAALMYFCKEIIKRTNSHHD